MSEVKQLDWLEVHNYENITSGVVRETYKAQVDGGWIYHDYCEVNGKFSTTMCFVPDAFKDDTPEKSASDADNENELREVVSSHNLRIEHLFERIEKLECWASEEEKKADLAFENIDAKYELFSDRLVKLEERLRDLEDWTRKDEETIKGRIKKLERREGHLSQFEQDYQKSMDNIQVNLDRHLDMHNEHYQNHETAMKEIQHLIISDDDKLSKIAEEERQTGYINALDDFYDMARQNLITDDESGALYVKYLISTFHKLKYEAESK